MSRPTNAYRALPATVANPASYARLSETEFARLEASEIDSASSQCDGHLSTVIWHTMDEYVVEIRLRDHSDVFILTPCTVTPTFGMDLIDGMFAQDAEGLVLQEWLDFETDRLDVFAGRSSISMTEYVNARGLPAEAAKLKRWWQFWKS